MLPAAKMMDPVLGVDIHLIQPPGPVPPVPIPHPFVGMLFDPMELAPVIGASVFVNGMPKATAGSEGRALPPHIPIGGVFVPPPPGNECEMFMGSATVLFEGEPASYMALPALSCQSIGIPAPFRRKKKPKPILKLPTSVVLPIPMGTPVLIGGPPTISMTVMAMKAAMGAAGKAAGKLRKMQKASKKAKAVSDRIHKAAKKAMDKLGVPPSVQNKVHKSICTVTGHPVDVATGKVFTDNVDFEIPGPIPLRWERTWYSTSTYQGPLGHGWHHAYDLALAETEKAVAVRFHDGRPLAFPRLEPGEAYFLRSEKVTLLRDSEGYALRTRDRHTYRFALRPGALGEHPLTSLSDAAGHSLLFAYDARGRLEALRDSADRMLKFATDWEGRITRILGPHPEDAGQEVVLMTYRYDDAGDLVEALDALGQPWRFAYEHHLLARETNRNGLSFHFEYDGRNASARCLRTWGDGGIHDHKLTYDGPGKVTMVEDSLGHRKTFHVAESGLVTQVVDPLGRTTSTRYNAFNEVETVVDELDQETVYAYDERGNCIQVHKPGGATFAFRFEDDDLVAVKDSLSGDSTWKYDSRHRPVKRTDPLGRVTELRYEGPFLMALIDPAGAETRLQYGPSGDTTAMITPDGAATRWEYDGLGRCVADIDSRGNVRRRTFDLLGRVRKEEEPDGNVRDLAYDPEGNIVRARDRHHDVTFRYQGLNRLAARIESGTALEFLYDREERLIGIRNEHGSVYSYELDPAGEVAVETGFDGIRRTFSRDAKGRVAAVERAGGLLTRYAYDAADRIVQVEHSNGEREAYRYRVDGALMEAVNGVAKVAYRRDALGRVLAEEQGDHTVESVYGLLGLRTEVKSSLGAHQRIERNAMGDAVRLAYGAEESAPRWEARFLRDAAGLEMERSLPGGVKARWSRDKVGRPLRHSLVTPREFRSREYTWDVNDRLQSLRDSRHGLTTYGHDPLGTLIRSEGPDGVHLFRIPDAVGNLFRSPDREDRVYGPGGRLLEARGLKGVTRYAYDPEGNLVGKTGPGDAIWTYRWNAAGTLAEVVRPDGLVVEFAYDALGRRIRKASGGTLTTWIWDGHNPLHEQEGPGLTTWIFEPDTAEPCARIDGERSDSLLTDHLGAPIAVYDKDGREIRSSDLDIYGNAVRVAGEGRDQPFRHQGQYEDRETGLFYNRFRYYDPEIGQYISQDPLRLRGGAGLYAYVADPLRSTDILGLHTALAWFNGQRVNRPLTSNPHGPSTPRWQNMAGSGSNSMAPSGLGRAGDSENLILEHLEASRTPAELRGGFLEIESVRSAQGSALPACDDCAAGMQEFANRHDTTVVYRVTEGRGNRVVRAERVFRPQQCGGG